MHFFLYCYAHPRQLRTFPTRRSSDLIATRQQQCAEREPDEYRLLHLWRDMTEQPDRDHRDRRQRQKAERGAERDRKSTRLNSSHTVTPYSVLCLKKTSAADAGRTRNR